MQPRGVSLFADVVLELEIGKLIDPGERRTFDRKATVQRTWQQLWRIMQIGLLSFGVELGTMAD